VYGERERGETEKSLGGKNYVSEVGKNRYKCLTKIWRKKSAHRRKKRCGVRRVVKREKDRRKRALSDSGGTLIYQRKTIEAETGKWSGKNDGRTEGEKMRILAIAGGGREKIFREEDFD